MKGIIKGLLLVLPLILVVYSHAQVAPEWYNFRGSVTFNGELAPKGTFIEAFDPDSVMCGTFTIGVSPGIDSVGWYGWLPVDRDDITTDTIDEGADPGDTITFKVMDVLATVDSGEVVWVAHGEWSEVLLSITTIVDLDLVGKPNDTLESANKIIRFYPDIQNTGTGTDFYSTSINSSKGWMIRSYDSLTFTGTDSAIYNYNKPESTLAVFFDVVIPVDPGNQPDTVIYDVFSRLDTTKRVTDTIIILTPFVDVEDQLVSQLPGGFDLGQNFPNPFNPTTTIAFSIPVKSAVQLEVFNILGRQVDVRDLGILSAGDHRIQYDASRLTSGVYLYRLTTELGNRSRKMILAR